MSFRRWYRRYRTMWVSFIACLAFLGLAIYGWGVEWADLWSALWVSALLLTGLILLAAVVGFIIHLLRSRFSSDPRLHGSPKSDDKEPS